MFIRTISSPSSLARHLSNSRLLPPPLNINLAIDCLQLLVPTRALCTPSARTSRAPFKNFTGCLSLFSPLLPPLLSSPSRRVRVSIVYMRLAKTSTSTPTTSTRTASPVVTCLEMIRSQKSKWHPETHVLPRRDRPQDKRDLAMRYFTAPFLASHSHMCVLLEGIIKCSQAFPAASRYNNFSRIQCHPRICVRKKISYRGLPAIALHRHHHHHHHHRHRHRHRHFSFCIMRHVFSLWYRVWSLHAACLPARFLPRHVTSHHVTSPSY